MTTEITNYEVQVQPWYVNLIDDCKTIVVETEFTSRWALVEGYHGLGTRILQENENFERAKIYGQEIVQRIATSISKRPRTVYYAIKFARAYPNLNLLPEAKNTSWHHIVNKYLTDGAEKPTIKKVDLARMIKQIKQLLKTEWDKAHQDFMISRQIEDGKKCEFIRYLQDQVEKITGELNG